MIFSLIVQVTLPLMQKKYFFDPVNLIVHRWDTKNKQICHWVLLKQIVKLHQLSTSFMKVVLHTGLNVPREIVTNSLLMCYKRSKTRPSLYTSLVFLVTFTKACPIPIQNKIHSRWIEMKEIPKYKLYDHIGDLSKATF